MAGKYYGDFLTTPQGDQTPEQLRETFEQALHAKISHIAARPDAPEVVTVQGRTAVVSGGSVAGSGNDVRVVHVGPPGESELVLAHLNEGVHEALQQLMGGTTDRSMVLDNLELVFLLIDEHADGGLILETDPNKLAAAVLLRDESEAEDTGGMPSSTGQPAQPGLPAGVTGDMSIGQAFRQARDQFMAGMTSRDGM